ncbi:hypothetical protein [Roseomonas elaeocarpi]|uniref:Uncharacterized protein n=1 Tax=Roseomonas elaeocarpi TaxID=907779 RepID=A0ABV6JQ98_9PROT
MEHYARFISVEAPWNDFGELVKNHADNAFERCPIQVLLDVGYEKVGGVSFWKIDPADALGIKRVVAAYFASRTTISSTMIKYISEDAAKSLRINFVRTDSKLSPDTDLAKTHHFDLRVRDAGTAFSLAKAMVGNEITYSSNEVAEAISSSLKSGFFALDKKFKAEIAHELLAKKRLTVS